MKIQLVSDAHLEFDKKKPHVINHEGEDVLVLAGDIQVGLSMEGWFSDLLETRDVVYVMGNHEFYGEDFTKLKAYLPIFEERVNEMAEKKGNKHKFYAFQNRTEVLHGVRFIGATMWTDFKNNDPIVKLIGQRNMTDYHVIKNNGFKLTPDDVYDDNQESINYIDKQLNTPFDGKTVVFTHHLPSYESVAQKYRTGSDAQFNHLYYSDYDVFACKADYWFHGHTHDSFDYNIGNCRVVCNPRGYNSPGLLNRNFKVVLVDI